ncbi:MAG: rhomboid family intramembrane serine protease [Anaerolineae bacterium]|nr:rhomboid family intramembrane serine protease [Anaerolineae bacterium]
MLAFFGFLLLILLELFLMSFVFPLPISDTGTVRYRSIPWMTILLILVNSLVFMLWQAVNLYQGSTAYEMTGNASMLDAYLKQVWTYGFRGSYLREGYSIGAFVTFTSIFMHSDMWHLFGNMIFLWTFGRRLEDACGPWRYLLFYLVAGMVANIGSELLNPSQIDLPGIGASGAISGVMGAYLILFPGAMINCLWGLGSIVRYPIVLVGHIFGIRGLKDAPMWRWTVRVPAVLLLIYFLAKDLIPSLEVIQQGQDIGGVNNLAHLTGFLAALVIILFTRKDLVMRFFSGRAV